VKDENGKALSEMTLSISGYGYEPSSGTITISAPSQPYVYPTPNTPNTYPDMHPTWTTTSGDTYTIESGDTTAGTYIVNKAFNNV
jgi:hypothetical protein